jgi:hypothetical protein
MGMQVFPIWEFIPSMNPDNPPVRYVVQWASPETDKMMHEVCYVCHSNETQLPVYTRIAPISWIAAEHVNEGRARLNFSEQPLEEINPGLLIGFIQADRMPPEAYKLMHPEAHFTEEQKAILIQGIRDTFDSTLTTARAETP